MSGLTFAIATHVVLGIVLAAVVWSTGAGLLLALGLDRRRPAVPELVYAYPLGLVAVSLATALYLLEPFLGVLAAVAVAGPAVFALVRRAVLAGAARRAGVTLLASLPGLVTVSVALGHLYHGPAASRDSSVSGDIVWYVAKLASAQSSLVPLRDLAVSGVDLWRAELAPTLIGAAVEHLPGIDAFLFNAASLPAYLLTSLAFGWALVREPAAGERVGDRRPPPVAWIVCLAALSLAMTAYPSWLVESPPVTLALPLAFAVHRAFTSAPPARLLVPVGGAVALGTVLTKGFVLVPIALLALASLREPRRLTRRRLGWLVLGSALAGAVLVGALQNSLWILRLLELGFTPVDAYHGLESQLSVRSTQELAPALFLFGQIALGLALWRAGEGALLAALAALMLGLWLVQPDYFTSALAFVVLLSVLRFSERAPERLAVGVLVASSAIAFAFGVWFRDHAGLRAAFVLVLGLGASTFAALSVTRAEAARRWPPAVAAGLVLATGTAFALSGNTALALAATVLTTGALVAVAHGSPALAVRRGILVLAPAVTGAAVTLFSTGLGFGRAERILTPDDYEIWQRVSSVVPEGGLVFTSLTGPGEGFDEGFSYYPAVSKRQIFLAGWYQSPLRADPEELRRRLVLNERVLAGSLAPARAAAPASYSAYFAVVRRSEPVPAVFRLLYRNGRFALFRIPGRGSAFAGAQDG